MTDTMVDVRELRCFIFNVKKKKKINIEFVSMCLCVCVYMVVCVCAQSTKTIKFNKINIVCIHKMTYANQMCVESQSQ